MTLNSGHAFLVLLEKKKENLCETSDLKNEFKFPFNYFKKSFKNKDWFRTGFMILYRKLVKSFHVASECKTTFYFEQCCTGELVRYSCFNHWNF